MLKKSRVALALLFWLGITLLFLDLTGALRVWLGWMAKIQFLPAVMAVNVGVVVLWVVVTLLVGRIYCSVICPLGVMQDGMIHFADWVIRRVSKRKVGRYQYDPVVTRKWFRIAFFVIFLVSLLMGFGFLVQWLAPYSSYGRMVSALLRPFALWINDGLADMAAGQESYLFYHVTWHSVSLGIVATVVVTVLILLALTFTHGRLYCNMICPVGAVLGLLARRSILRIHIDADKCVKCGLCERQCKAEAIHAQEASVDHSLCVDCFNCLDACHKQAISFGMVRKEGSKTPVKEPDTVDSTRRTLLATAVAVTAAARLKAEEKTVDGVLGVIEDKKRYERETPICPPGAGSLKHLQQHCTGCQLCVTACPNGVLTPSTGLRTYLQPMLSYENGHCRPECHACSDVCPAGAIRPLGISHEEKMSRKANLKIGRAVWLKENCVPLTGGGKCGNCARHCPTGAITMVPSNPDDKKSPMIPSVDEERCIGCGACEHLCPSRPYSAIHVEGIEVQREI